MRGDECLNGAAGKRALLSLVASRWQNKRLEGRSLAIFREKVRAEKNYDAALHFK